MVHGRLRENAVSKGRMSGESSKGEGELRENQRELRENFFNSPFCPCILPFPVDRRALQSHTDNTGSQLPSMAKLRVPLELSVPLSQANDCNANDRNQTQCLSENGKTKNDGLVGENLEEL